MNLRAGRVVSLVAASLFFASTAMAAGLTGVWSGTLQGREGKSQPLTLTLKGSAEALTGTLSGNLGEFPVENLKINGSQISFDIVVAYQGQSRKFTYSGTVDGTHMSLKMSRDGQQMAGSASLDKTG